MGTEREIDLIGLNLLIDLVGHAKSFAVVCDESRPRAWYLMYDFNVKAYGFTIV